MEPPPLLVLYGSETGNARDVAERIAREAARDGGGHTMTRRPRRRVHCLPMDSFEVTQLPTAPLIVCVCSTTGQGDPPANMRQFWRFLLRKSLPPDSLADVKFAVFGLGDSHYQKYNVAAKKLHRRMRALGAVELVGLGLGDDQHPTGYEATLDPWLDELWRSLGHGTDAEGGHGGKTDLVEDLVLDPCRVAVDVVAPPPVGSTQHESHDNVEDRVRELCDAARELDRALEAAAAIPPRLLRGTHGTVGPDGDPMTVSSSSGHAFGEYHPAVATVTVNTPLTAADADAEVRHLEVATADLRRAPTNSESTTGVPDVLQADELPPLYTPGDCLAVLPLPLAECDVARARDATGTVLERAGLAPDAWVTLRAPGGHLGGRSEFISKPVRAASLVEGALDLTSASARRYFFEVASTFASHPQEAERLRHFAGKDGRDELWYYNERERRSVAEFLSDFPSVAMPLEWMLTTAPRLRHRLFSISSSPLPHPHALHLTVTAARWKTHYGRIREGLCSNSLARAEVSAALACWLVPTFMAQPKDTTPLLLVCTGSGVAPLRAFVQARVHRARAGQTKIAPSLVFFGCRRKAGDFLYRREWEELAGDPVALVGDASTRQGPGGQSLEGGFIPAFSRDGDAKDYVQHRVASHAARVWNMLEAGAAVYVAGSSASMPQDVRDTLSQVVEACGRMSRDDAGVYLRRMEASGRYVVEAW